MKRRNIALFIVILLMTVFCFFNANVFALETTTDATTNPLQNLNINLGVTDESGRTVESLQLFLVLTVISLSPYLLLMMTCFTRIIIAMHFLRAALGTQSMPPNQILIGISLVLTFNIMAPTFEKINETAIKPLSERTITQEVAIERALIPVRHFMYTQVDTGDISLFSELAGIEFYIPSNTNKNENTDTFYSLLDEIPLSVLMPAFVLGELTKGFIIGFILYIPFIVIDMVVASTLMAMGMMMLPPAMISLPFKIMLFVIANGWQAVLLNIARSFF